MKICFALIITILLLACNGDENTKTTCDFSGTFDEYPWLLELKDTMTNCTCEISIVQGTYHHQTVIFIALTDPLCDGINTPVLYNCEGKPIRSFSGSKADQRELTKVTSDVVLYRCKT